MLPNSDCVPERTRRAPRGFQPRRLRLDLRRFDVEVHSVLDHLGFGDALEEELRQSRVRGEEEHVATGGAKALIAEGGAPELGQLLGVGAVKDEADAVHGFSIAPREEGVSHASPGGAGRPAVRWRP